jgi:hypothetical protein
MSVAHQMSRFGTMVEGGAARPLPTVNPAPRTQVRPKPKPKPKQARRVWVFGTAAWCFVMLFAALLVHRNTLVVEETAAITKAREGLAALKLQNYELQTRLVKAQSVDEVEKWAVAQGMKRPVAIQKLDGDPTAVAVRPARGPAAAQPATESKGFTAAIKSYLARFTGFSAGN